MIAFHCPFVVGPSSSLSSPHNRIGGSILRCGIMLFLLKVSCLTLVFAEGYQGGRLHPRLVQQQNANKRTQQYHHHAAHYDGQEGDSTSGSSSAPASSSSSMRHAGNKLRGGSTRLKASSSSVLRMEHRAAVNAPAKSPTTTLDASATATIAIPTRQHTTPFSQQIKSLTKKMDIGFVLGLAYFFTDLCCRAPVALLPTISSEIASAKAAHSLAFSQAGFVASVASISFLGGGIGKLVNGGVCQAIGGKKSLSIYMFFIGFFSLLLSFNQSTALFGPILACVEFGMSMRWPACLVVLEKYCQGDAGKVAAAITTLSLMSTAGNVLSKVLASLLLSATSWQNVSRLGSMMALTGAGIAYFVVEDREKATRKRDQTNPDTSLLTSLRKSFAQVLGTKFFWMIGLAHLPGFVASVCDKLLGSYYVHASGLSESLCGGLTTSCTLGLVFGLTRSKEFFKLKHKSEKMAYIRNNYLAAVLSFLGLAVCGGPWMAALVPSKYAMAGILAALSFTLNSSIAFPFYQIAGLVMNEFTPNVPIFLALMDGVGYFAAGPIFGAASGLISQLKHGWTVTWVLMAILLTGGGSLMLHSIEPILEKKKDA